MPRPRRARVRVTFPPDRPVAVYDGECPFCSSRVGRWAAASRGCIDLLPSREAASRFAEIPREMIDASLVLVDTDGETFTGAEAVLRMRASSAVWRALLAMYHRLPPLRAAMEIAYRIVSRHRKLLPGGRPDLPG